MPHGSLHFFWNLRSSEFCDPVNFSIQWVLVIQWALYTHTWVHTHMCVYPCVGILHYWFLFVHQYEPSKCSSPFQWPINAKNVKSNTYLQTSLSACVPSCMEHEMWYGSYIYLLRNCLLLGVAAIVWLAVTSCTCVVQARYQKDLNFHTTIWIVSILDHSF